MPIFSSSGLAELCAKADMQSTGLVALHAVKVSNETNVITAEPGRDEPFHGGRFIVSERTRISIS